MSTTHMINDRIILATKNAGRDSMLICRLSFPEEEEEDEEEEDEDEDEP